MGVNRRWSSTHEYDANTLAPMAFDDDLSTQMVLYWVP